MSDRGILTECPKCGGPLVYKEVVPIFKPPQPVYKAFCKDTITCNWKED